MAARTPLSRGANADGYGCAAASAIPSAAALDQPLDRPAGGLVTGHLVSLPWAAEHFPISLAWAAGTLFVVAMLGLRWATRSQYLFDLDSILYARALDNFDLRLVQPPLPGYYLYIQMGRAVRAVLGDANLSLVFLSWLLGALLLPAIYALGRELFDHRTGLVAALLALTGPVFWYQSDIASPRIAEALFATVVVWLGVRLKRRGEPWTFWALPVALAVAGGVRQQLLLYLVPFAIWATWQKRWRERLKAAFVGACLVLAWAVPTLAGAGGIDEYRVLSSAQWQAFVVNQTGVFTAPSLDVGAVRLMENVARVGAYAIYVCFAGPVLVLAALRTPRRTMTSLPTASREALVLATVPALLFYALVHVQQIGHVLAIAPLICLVAARLTTSSGSDARVVGTAAAAAAINLLFVFGAPSHLIAQRAGTPTVATIQERDAFIASGIATVRSDDPSATLILTSPLSYGYVEEYAPGYTYYLVTGIFEPSTGRDASLDQRVITNGALPTPDGSIRASSLVAHPSGAVAVPDGVRRLVAISYETDLSSMLAGARPPSGPADERRSVAVVDAAAGSLIRFWPGHVRLIGPPG